MKNGLYWLACLLLFASGLSLRAQETHDDWLVKLSSGNYAVRARAAQMLEQRGAAALPLLDKVMSSADLETKRRALLIVERIEDRLLQDDVLRPTTVRLQLRDVPLQEALRVIERQLGLTVGNVTDRERPIRLEKEHVPYWQAWQSFCTAAQLQEGDYTRSAAPIKPIREQALNDLLKPLDLRPTTARSEALPRYLPPRMEFADRSSAANYSCDDRHSIRVRVKWLRMAPLAAGEPSQAIFALEVRAEARLHLTTHPLVEITKIVDAQGQERSVAATKMQPETILSEEAVGFLKAYNGEIQYGGLLHLRAIPWPYRVHTLKEVHGQVQLQLLIQPRLMEIRDPFKAVGKEIRSKEGIVLKILDASREEGEIHLRLYLDQLESLTPKTLEQQVVRLRPGVVVIRGAVDVALERLQLLQPNGLSYRCEKSQYRTAGEGKGHVVDLIYSADEQESEAPTLVLTGTPRVLPVQMPFVVRAVAPPTMND